MKIIKIIFILLLFNTVIGCSALSAAKAVLGGGTPTVGIEATLGDKEEAVVGQVGSKQDIAVESLSGGITTTHIQDIPVIYMLLMILGWMAPSPSQMINNFLSGTKKLIKFIFKRGAYA